MNIVKYLFLSCLLLCLEKAYAQEINFNHLTTDDGLSHNSVLAIYQDERGFIWVGTRNGVNLYNGNRFTIYKFQKNDPNSLVYNNVSQITGNGKGVIYFMTAQGISMFNTSEGHFTTLLRGVAGRMYYHNQLYISQKNIIYKYDNEQLIPFYTLENANNSITALYVCDDYLLIGTEKEGLYRLDSGGKLTQLIPKENVSSIFKDSTGKIWIGTWNSGAYLLDRMVITNFNDANSETGLSSNFVRSFCEDKQGNIWIGTYNGLNKLNTKNGRFTHYYKKEGDKSLTHSSVWSLLCDKQGTIWVGTYFGGINYFNLESQIYYHFQSSDVEGMGLSESIVSCITEDSLRNLWICTEGGGITKFNPTTHTFQWYRHTKNSNSLSHDNVKTMYYDHASQTMWIGTHMGGLNKLDIRSGRFTCYYIQNSSNIIREITPYKDKLIITTTEGLYYFYVNSGQFVPLIQNKINYAASSCIDHRGMLWVSGNGQGVYSYRFETDKIVNYKHYSDKENSISSDNIGRVYEDSQKRLWFCTVENGVDLYRYDTDDFENFDEQKNGLQSNCVYDVCELSPTSILFTTDCGFSILDYPSRKFTNYNRNTGLPLSAINERSVYKAMNGNIYIGGMDGMMSFKQSNINYTPKDYEIQPFRLFINGKEVGINDETGVLKQALFASPKITLKSNQSMFSIEYSVSNYIPSNGDEIEYRLDGFSDSWTSLYEQRNITYTNLDPGNYTLLVRAKNNPSIPESRLAIEVLPPFYRTGWAYLLYALCACGIFIFLFRTYNHRIKLQESLKYEKKHAQDIELLNQSKLRFFTNISHEFRTPLTLILGQAEILLQLGSIAPIIYSKILSIYKNSQQMNELITELLDFRKQEQGYMTIKVKEHNMVDSAYESYLLFQEYALAQKITFNFSKTHDVIPVWYDHKQFQKVMNNLISNAFKYTKEGGQISVSVRKGNQEVIIEVTDNGSGISKDEISKIFDRFYQTEETKSLNHMGTGIGLSLTKGIVELHHGTIEVYSTPNEETTFSIHLKMGKEHFTPEQICNSMEEDLQAAMKDICVKDIPLLVGNGQNLSKVELEAEAVEVDAVESDEAETTKTEVAGNKEEKMKILIVEDNESLCGMLTEVFQSFYHVITAANGVEGWEKVQSECPHIVLSDVVMPEMSGTELCKLIKSNIETCHIPVVLLTARTAVEHNLEGLRLGADDYITKPFNIHILLTRCNNLVNNRIMLQEKFSQQLQITPQILATNSLDKDFINKVMTVIERYIDNPTFNVDILATEMAIARTKLYKKIADITGQTPHDFIVTIRLKRAAVMLREDSNLNVSEISDKVGFSSPRQFSKSFKEKFKVVPQEYRRGKI